MSGLIRLIRADDLEGAFFLKDFTDEGTMIDGQGHGTHVAGTIGSVTWGVAKKTTLLAVRVLDSLGFGTTAGVLAGMNCVVTDAKARRDAGQCANGIVANMSLGGRRLQAMNDAVSNSFPVFRSSLLTLI
jgi:subtilisin family serine protease